MTAQKDKERLLSVLHAHGQQFLSAFDIPAAPNHETKDSDGSEPEEEWTGIRSLLNISMGTSETASNGEHDGVFEQENDGFAASSSRTPDVTVFLESTRKQPTATASLSAKELRKSFMSSKLTNITSSSMQPVSKEKIPDGESGDEQYVSPTTSFTWGALKGSDSLASTNTQNDALLHRLVHTKLLSGSLNPELDLNHAQRGKALTGRVLELAGEAKLGRGESVFRQEQRNKAAKHVRDGLVRKQKEQEQKALEEAKNLGNYHPTLKRLYDSNPSSTPKKKRARGLGMGIGKFVGGTLKLSREEIVSVTGSGRRLRDNVRRGIRQRPR